MLLAFRAENVRSFRGPIELSLLSTRLSDPEARREISWRKEGREPIGVLPAAGVFGANASGKSNLLRAMNDMKRLAVQSFREGWPEDRTPPWPFRLGEEVDEIPSRYEVDIVLEGVRHDYGFVLGRAGVLHEWAHAYPHGQRRQLFDRRGEDVSLGREHMGKGRAARGVLRKDSLFLSAAAAAGHPGLTPLYDWFRRNLLLAEEGSRGDRQALSAKMMEDDTIGRQALGLLQEADLGITGAEMQDISPELTERIQQAVREFEEDGGGSEGVAVRLEDFEVRLTHRAAGGEVKLQTNEESKGTLVWLGLIGPVIHVLRLGSVLLADELDTSLHPALVDALVRLFQSKRSNPNRAQLIFNSHDVSLLGDAGSRVLGRDQIWFTEKGDDGGTHLFPLTDMDPRREEAVGRRYLAGRYGAMPILSQPALEGIAGLAASERKEDE